MDIIDHPYLEFAFGVLGLIFVIFIHGVGVRRIARWFSARWARIGPGAGQWSVNLLFASVIAALVLLHLVETLAVALVLTAARIIPVFRDAYYYALESYTTLGSTLVAAPEGWRLTGPLIAMAGLFTFGWTASVLVSVMTDISRLDRAEAVRKVRDHAAGED
ncbi:two pore domain potassium channel family protein [Amaricoccus solimangrovi]|uniref:Two pore domain potassium channel family protein n=1 Tax=Amaricoccus solimangrovi TaxID=2589815 RepID=A0A501WQ40_9RHOB|nr:two pore domain potassium channel family protein [Amaricoccus solimangrovi]TPE50445.1 two pore domain potassium channel family protein [Amaricoccus solimangrovi]